MDIKRKPSWLKISRPLNANFARTQNAIKDLHVSTVCSAAKCPNRGECWAKKSAAFMILGENCTRSCRFCAVLHNTPLAPDPSEPMRVAEAAARLGISHITITSVTRDDLDDGGAEHWAQTVHAIRLKNPSAKIEILTPDFCGRDKDIDTVLDSPFDIFNHNLETVRVLQKSIRGKADYETSLYVLRRVASKNFLTKSGIMLGLGETINQVEHCICDLKNAGVQILTIGQYIPPTPKHAPLDRWVEPREFEYLKSYALKLGFKEVQSAPLVRSSYRS